MPRIATLMGATHLTFSFCVVDREGCWFRVSPLCSIIVGSSTFYDFVSLRKSRIVVFLFMNLYVRCRSQSDTNLFHRVGQSSSSPKRCLDPCSELLTMVLLRQRVHPRGLSLKTKEKVFFMKRRILKRPWGQIAKEVFNDKGKRPYWKVVELLSVS